MKILEIFTKKEINRKSVDSFLSFYFKSAAQSARSVAVVAAAVGTRQRYQVKSHFGVFAKRFLICDVVIMT